MDAIHTEFAFKLKYVYAFLCLDSSGPSKNMDGVSRALKLSIIRLCVKRIRLDVRVCVCVEWTKL